MKTRRNGDATQKWWDELERLARILGQIGPDEVCCDGLSQRQTAILRVLVASEGARLTDLAALSGITPERHDPRAGKAGGPWAGGARPGRHTTTAGRPWCGSQQPDGARGSCWTN